MKKNIRKYTDIAVLLDIISSKKITLTDPDKWDDKNDVHYINVYKRLNGYKTVLATCFVESDERYHHWKIYAGSSNGICIEFDKIELTKYCEIDGVETRSVQYAYIKELKELSTINKADIAFYKRMPFQDESEFRIVYHTNTDELKTFGIPIDLSCITRVIINPWLNINIANSIKKVLKELTYSYISKTNIQIFRSTLLQNKEWIEIANDFEKNFC